MPEEVVMEHPVRVTVITSSVVLRVVDDGFGGRMPVHNITGIRMDERGVGEWDIMIGNPAEGREFVAARLDKDGMREDTIPALARFTNEAYEVRVTRKGLTRAVVGRG